MKTTRDRAQKEKKELQDSWNQKLDQTSQEHSRTIKILTQEKEQLAEKLEQVTKKLDHFCGNNLEALDVNELRKIHAAQNENIHKIKLCIEKKSEDKLCCCVCMEKEKCMIVMPCRHMPYCEECSKKRNSSVCPLCKGPIVELHKIFL